MNSHELTISPLGDNAIILNLGNIIDETINRKVLYLFQKLKTLALPFVTDIVPAYSSLVIFYDLLILKNKNTCLLCKKICIGYKLYFKREKPAS